MTCLSHARLIAARAAFAISSSRPPPALLGTITLRMDQRLIVARAEAAIARDGGCIIADEVGRGKSYVALALAQRWRAPLVVAPASLRDGWALAMRRSGVTGAFVSHEMLSREWSPTLDHDGIVIDESHHFRNPATRRHATLARIGAFAPLVLLSATPVQNSARDLIAQLSLYLGASTSRLTLEQLGARVLRGVPLTDGTLPAVAPPRWLRPEIDDGLVLDALLALPPPPRVADGGEAGALREISMVRAWASSRAALRRLVLRRQRSAVAMEQCLESNRVPSRAELLSWTEGDDAVQLGFAALLAETVAAEGDRSVALEHVAGERQALTRLLRMLAETDDPDRARADALRSVRDQFARVGVIAFTESASTAREYYARLAAGGSVGLLTARGARIASGALSRRELLARFAPIAQGATHVAPHERVTLLITTDILAEGVNLQDASVVVHLDLPWNPARLTQRLGRVRRPGGGAVVHSFLMAPPAAAARLLETEHRMRRKLAIARAAIGEQFDVLPILATARGADDTMPNVAVVETPAMSAERFGTIEALVARWHRPARQRPSRDPPVPYVAAAHSPTRGWIAALSDGRRLASLDDQAADADRTLVPALMLAAGRPRRGSRSEQQHASRLVERWLAAERLAQLCGIAVPDDPLRRALAHRSATELRRLPRHLRDAALVLGHELRIALAGPLSLGAERLLAATQATAARNDDPLAWLRAASGIAQRVTTRGLLHASDAPSPYLVALITLGDCEKDVDVSAQLVVRP